MLKKQQIEIAARKLCELRGEDPDQQIHSVSRDGRVKLVNMRWQQVAATVIEHDRILDAIAFAKEQK